MGTSTISILFFTPSSRGNLSIVGVSLEPEYPWEGDTVGFSVEIGGTYSDVQDAVVKLYVDGELKDSREVSVGTFGTSVTLYWLATQGSILIL